MMVGMCGAAAPAYTCLQLPYGSEPSILTLYPSMETKDRIDEPTEQLQVTTIFRLLLIVTWQGTCLIFTTQTPGVRRRCRAPAK